MEILSSKISVYEIEVNIGILDSHTSSEFLEFPQALAATIPSLSKHQCAAGKEGGFFQEIEKGTDFAHILEHVILELQHLANPYNGRYSGWTSPKRDGEGNRVPGVYIIHFETRDPLTGQLAALIALRLIKNLIKKRPVDVDALIEILKNPERLLQGYSPEAKVVAFREGLLKLLGLKTLQPGYLELLRHSEPFLQELRDKTGGTVTVRVLEEGELVGLKVLESLSLLKVSYPVGHRAPFNFGSHGMILSAYLPEEELARLIREKGLKSFTPKTITDPLEFKHQLALVREAGFSFSDEKAVVGVRAIAAPIRDGRGQVVAAIGIALPVANFPLQDLKSLADMVTKTAQAISDQIKDELIEPTSV